MRFQSFFLRKQNILNDTILKHLKMTQFLKNIYTNVTGMQRNIPVKGSERFYQTWSNCLKNTASLVNKKLPDNSSIIRQPNPFLEGNPKLSSPHGKVLGTARTTMSDRSLWKPYKNRGNEFNTKKYHNE